jgi:hypothetical protein
MVAGLYHVTFFFQLEVFPSMDLEKVQKVLSVIFPFLPLPYVVSQAGFVVG